MSNEAKQVRRAVRNTLIRLLRTSLIYNTANPALIKAARNEQAKIAAQIERTLVK